ncbi:MAG TPA: hypothetical protein VKV79_01625 [Terriglobia bacterium]|nr:hypothetical protein [Terriglobia bacterium]
MAPGRTAWFAVVVGAVLLCAACSPASVAFREGRKAEEQKDYDSAIIDFQKALKYQPANSRLLMYEKEARSKASLFHAEQGERLLAQNRPDAASGEFQKAVSIDPSNMAAAQNLQRLLLQQSALKLQHEQAIRKVMEQEETSQTALGVQLKPLPSQPIAHLHLSADSRTVFETLGKLAGINVVFYYNFQPKPVSLDLSNVTIQEALRAAADEAAVFWKTISRNTILVIPDTPSNRRDLETEVMKTVYLQNPAAAADRTAILTAVKQVVGVQKAFENPDSNSITMYDTPEKVAAAAALIHNLDRGKAEVLVDVTVLEADKDRLNDLGLAPVPLSGTTATMAAVGLNSTTSSLALNQLGRLTTGDFSIALPGVIANALLSDNRTHILQNPQIRVTAGDTARLRIGQRVPFATGSFGVPTAGVTGSSTSGFGLLANTQFQYQDVGVNLDITPEVAANGDIILHAKIDISAVGPSVNIGGVEEPTFTQRSIEHVIRLKEGEVSLLGGLMQTQTTRIVSGLPGLGDVPLLRFLFSTQSFETVDEEVLIMMTPRVVRLPEDQALSLAGPPTRSAAETSSQRGLQGRR